LSARCFPASHCRLSSGQRDKVCTGRTLKELEQKNGKQTHSERHTNWNARCNPSESWFKELGHEFPGDKCTRSPGKHFKARMLAGAKEDCKKCGVYLMFRREGIKARLRSIGGHSSDHLGTMVRLDFSSHKLLVKLRREALSKLQI